MQKFIGLVVRILLTFIAIVAVSTIYKQPLHNNVLFAASIIVSLFIGYDISRLVNRGRPIEDEDLRYDTLFCAGRVLGDEFVCMWEPSEREMHLVEFKDSMVFYRIKQELQKNPADGVMVIKKPSTGGNGYYWSVAVPITPENFPEVLKGFKSLNAKRKDIFTDSDGTQLHLRRCN
jgi:hypothetical protein